VAGWGVSNTYYKGEIDEFRIFNRVLSPEEINASYDNITALTENIDIDISAVASDPTKVSIFIGYTIDD